MQAIILAGGFGTRLQAVVNNVPKPMAPVAGRPFLCWLLEYMRGQGVTHSILCLHHGADKIISYFGHQVAGMELQYSVEAMPLGTGGAIYKALQYISPTQPVFVLNGDSLVQLNYLHMMQRHLNMGRQATLATFHVNDCSRYSKLHTKNDLVHQYDVLGDHTPGYISAGFYVLSPDLFNNNAMPEVFSFEHDFLHPQVPTMQPAYYDKVEYFIDIGVPKDYATAAAELPALLQTQNAA